MCGIQEPRQIATILQLIETLIEAKLSQHEVLLRLADETEIRGPLRGVTLHCQNDEGPLVCAVHLRGLSRDSIESVDALKVEEIIAWRRGVRGLLPKIGPV